MAMDIDVRIARERWQAGEWTAFDVCRSIALQWSDQHVEDADHDGSNVNAHSAADVAVFVEAAAACAVDLAKWIALAAAILPK